jgi:AraC-like DNA-binding protein
VTVNLRSAPPDVVVPMHRHTWAQLAYPISGAMQVAAAGMSWIVPAFRAVWIPPRIEHEVTMLGRVELRTLYIHADAAPLPLDACAVIEVSPLLRTLSETLGKGADEPADEPRRSLMMRLVLEEMRAAPPLSLGLALPRDRRLKALCEALMADPASPHGLREWAKEVGASERTLARLFLAEMNTSFTAWRQQLRLARALDAIGRGMPLSRVAADVGYDSPAAFSTMFKRALGVPPSRFVREAAA